MITLAATTQSAPLFDPYTIELIGVFGIIVTTITALVGMTCQIINIVQTSRQTKVFIKSNEIAAGGEMVSLAKPRPKLSWLPLISTLFSLGVGILLWVAVLYNNSGRNNNSVIAVLISLLAILSISVLWLLVGRPKTTKVAFDEIKVPSVPSPFAGEATEWVGKMGRNYKSFENGIYELDDEKGNRIATPSVFTAPVAFRIIAKTNSTNLRLSYVENEIIFNWEQYMDQEYLHIWKGPFASKLPKEEFNKRGAGRITKNEWHVFDLTYAKASFSISVDGFPKLSEQADFSQSRSPFSVFGGAYSTVHVMSVQSGIPKSVEIEQKPVQWTPSQIVYAEWVAIKDGKLYRVNTTLRGERLSDKIKPLFSHSPPEKLETGTLEVRDPIDGPHKQLKFRLDDDRCFSLDEYARINIASAILIAPFEPSNERLT